jgi:lipopolysaccharide transport system permease protein
LIFAAQLPWSFFASALSSASNSLVGNSHLISKVYFPRLLVPMSAIVVSLVDFLVAAVFFALLLVVYGVVPDWRVVMLPLFLAVAFGAALGTGLWLTALNVKYRDFRFVLPFVIQFGFYISPVVFTSDLVPERWRLLYSLNPMVGVIDGFRWALFRGATPLDLPGLAVSLFTIAVLLVTGLRYFRRTERTFADII